MNIFTIRTVNELNDERDSLLRFSVDEEREVVHDVKIQKFLSSVDRFQNGIEIVSTTGIVETRRR